LDLGQQSLQVSFFLGLQLLFEVFVSFFGSFLLLVDFFFLSLKVFGSLFQLVDFYRFVLKGDMENLDFPEILFSFFDLCL